MSEQLLCTLTIVQLSNEHSHDAEYTIDGHRIKLVLLLILSFSLPFCCFCNFTGGLSNGVRVSTALLLIWLIIFSH